MPAQTRQSDIDSNFLQYIKLLDSSNIEKVHGVILNVKWFPIGFHYFLNSEIFKLTIKNSKNKAQMNINN